MSATASSDELRMSSTRARILRRFLRHRMAVAAAVVLALLYLMMAFAEFLAPYTEAFEDRAKSFYPPTTIHWTTPEGSPTWPYVYDGSVDIDMNTGAELFKEDNTKPYPIRLFASGEEYKMWGIIPSSRHLVGVDEPCRLYLSGADQNGRDVLSRTIYGSRISLTVGVMAIMIVIPLGMFIGGVSGYFGGWIDNIMMRVVEALMAFPSFYLLLALFGVTYQWNITPTQRYYLITIILSLIGWTSLSRVIRGQVLAIRSMEFVEASIATGASHLWVIRKHVLPQTATWVIISASLSVPNYILGESALSMLGLGVQEPSASWGNMLEAARSLSSLTLHPWLLTPGFFIVLTVVVFNFFGDGLRDAFDAKQRV